MNTRTIKAAKNIAFIMNENNKTELIEWSYFNREILLPHAIIATAAAGKILEGTLNKTVNKLISGPRGEYRQLCDMIVEGKVDMIVFFGAQPRSDEFETLLETARENNIIIVLNRSTADFVFNSLLMNKDYLVEIAGPEDQKKEGSEPKRERFKKTEVVKAA
jgi:methylglyoxal synthase